MARTSKNDLVRLDEGDVPEVQEIITFGITRSWIYYTFRSNKKNSLVREKVYLHKIDDQISFIEVRTQEDADLLSRDLKMSNNKIKYFI